MKRSTLPAGTLNITLGVELLAAARQHASDHGTTLAEVVRVAVAKSINRPDLARVVKMGRPKKTQNPE